MLMSMMSVFYIFFLFVGLAFMESVKVTNSQNAVKFQKVGKSCFHDNSSAILESWSDVTRMKCAIDCVALSDCVAWDWRITHYTHKFGGTWGTYGDMTCRLLKWTPDKFEITETEDCVTYQLHRLSPVL